MSELMQVIFQYLRDYRIQTYLASDLEYQENPPRPERYFKELSDRLDPAGKKLLDQYREALCAEQKSTEKAIFQAALEFFREMNRML